MELNTEETWRGKPIDDLTEEELENFTSYITDFINKLNEKLNKGTFVNISEPLADVMTKTIAELQDEWGENADPIALALKMAHDRAKTEPGSKKPSALPNFSSIVPTKHVMPNNKFANNIMELVDGSATGLLVDSDKTIETRCVITYEGDNVRLSSKQPFTAYDRSVADAVTSLYLYGDQGHVITAASVYRAMVDAVGGESPSPQQIGAVTKSLDKMRFVRVQIDCSDELRSRGLSLDGEQITHGKIDTYLLALSNVMVKAGGQTISAYQILQPPILYSYANMTKQVITISAHLLAIKDSTGARIPNTEHRIVVRDYLIRRIVVMQRSRKQSNHILYETLYNAVGDAAKTDKQRRSVREYTASCLESWTRDGFIRGYETLKTGRKNTGVAIHLSSPKHPH